MRQTLKDYGYSMNHVPLLCDNESDIKIAYNPCEHSKTKHIDIQHHFLRDHMSHPVFNTKTRCSSYVCVTPHVSKPHDYINHMFMRLSVDQIRNLESNSKFSNSGLVWTIRLGC
jgi:hypothetical protein